MSQINYKELSPDDFEQIIALGNHVHGDGYLDNANILNWYNKGLKNNINSGFVAYDGEKLVGFRITFAVGNWDIDKWSSPNKWQVPQGSVCYFKCNTVDENYRGYGIGSELLTRSITAAIKQGAKAGVSHLWKQSPGNSAVKYFTKCGGELVQSHPDKWREDALNGYDCILCGHDCHCEAAEMIIYFS
ncbi:GNAT family N-acetyltransferase [Thalassotalea sp. M1531]|uniref:GNAT family N-acetyltransferase n=2 Tax=Thalassotalea algicola TaxID=2716224 RepID=A0A7Y0Q8H1_9GAMM|nr:GNAT family N-acetyltransferase [Thalassotalea algicola]